MIEDLCSVHPFTGDINGWTATIRMFFTLGKPIMENMHANTECI